MGLILEIIANRNQLSVMLYKEAVNKLINQVKQDNYSSIVLVGKSDLDFLVEHSCMKHHIDFLKNKEIGTEDNLFYLYGEEAGKKHIAYLRDIFINS